MARKTLTEAFIVGVAAALIFAAAAAFLFAEGGAVATSAWVLVGGAVAASYVALRVRAAGRELDATLGRVEARAEQLEEQVELQRRSVDTLAEGLDVAIFVCDARANILYANRRAVEMFHFEQPIGRSILAVTLSYDLEQLVLDAHRLKQERDAELAFSYPDERMGVAKAWPPDQTSDRVFVSVFEITHLRRLERIRQDFVSNVSHELRTPLTVIRAMAETMLDDPADQETSQRYLPKIISEVDRLSTISNDLLILSAAESNPVRKAPCDVAEVFRNVTQQLEPKAKEKGLELTYEGPEAAVVEANTAQMTQVAINLIDNAINYTMDGSVAVSVEPAADHVTIKVADTGIGISTEHLPRIFERFYRVDRARSRSTGGTGLGLSIVKHIVEAHGGKVTVESAMNKGSVFTVRLPEGDLVHRDES